MRKGQALVELALILPLLLVLALGGVALARAADARAGLDAATLSALSAAARSTDPQSAGQAAGVRFASIAGSYPLRDATLQLELGDFHRGGRISATSRAAVDMGFAPLPGFPGRVQLTATASATAEPWRSRLIPMPAGSPPLPPGGGCRAFHCRPAGG